MAIVTSLSSFGHLHKTMQQTFIFSMRNINQIKQLLFIHLEELSNVLSMSFLLIVLKIFAVSLPLQALIHNHVPVHFHCSWRIKSPFYQEI